MNYLNNLMTGLSALLNALIPGARRYETLSGRSHRSQWILEELIDSVFDLWDGDEHSRRIYELEKSMGIHPSDESPTRDKG